MRKIAIATALTVVLAGTASASDVRFQDRGPRDRDTPIVRVLKNLKRLLNPSTHSTPTVPVPNTSK